MVDPLSKIVNYSQLMIHIDPKKFHLLKVVEIKVIEMHHYSGHLGLRLQSIFCET